MKLIYIGLILLLQVTFAANDEKVPDKPVQVSASIISNDLIAITYKNYPHWHTYWKNPGDAGLPIKVSLLDSNDNKIEIEELEWPIPKRYIEKGNMWAFGYEGEYSLFYKLDKAQLKGKTTTLKTNWLVCKHICVPGNKTLKITPSLSITGNDYQASSEEIQKHLKSLPIKKEVPSYLNISLGYNQDKTGLILYASISKKTIFSPEGNLLTPFPIPLFGFTHEKQFRDQKKGLYSLTEVEWEGEYEEPPVLLPKDGQLEKPYLLRFIFFDPILNSSYIVEKEVLKIEDNFDKMSSLYGVLQEKSLDPPDKKNSNKKETTAKKPSESNEESSLLFYLVFAFIGGLILNVMPCVLPVISIKLFGLIKHQNESKSKILRHNLFYTFGVLTTFMLLGVAVHLLKQAGETVGWGFQLQSPKFILFIIIVLFIFSLNLFGLFEFKTPLGNKLGGAKLEEGPIGDFFSGVIATILSTPCSAPFLGTALTFAFTGDILNIYLIFFMIGLGLSAPFLLTGFFPSLVSFLPRPGAWMEHLKKFLALTLLLTIVWLIDVFSAQVDTSLEMIKLNSGLILTFFSFYAVKNIFKSKIKYAFHLVPIFFFFSLFNANYSMNSSSGSDLIRIKQKEGLNWEKWTPIRMENLQKDGELVFVDFTAKWCFTCKINEKLVLNTSEFQSFVKENNIKLLLADWTKKDPIIGDWLKAHGYAGVPAYFVINKQGKLIDLGETISIGEIKKSFQLD